MILVPVGDKHTAQPVLVVDDVGEIGNNDVDAKKFIVGEAESAVHHDAVPAAFIHGAVFADLAETTERDEPQRRRRIDPLYLLLYGIDLLSVKYLHWYEFLSLLRALPDDSMTMRRVGYRSTDLNQIPDKRQRARIAKIQRQIALPFEFDDEMIGAMMWNA